MKYLILITIIFLNNKLSVVGNDFEYSNSIIGGWEYNKYWSNGNMMTGKTVYSGNGYSESIAYLYNKKSNNTFKYKTKEKWKIINGKNHYKVVETNVPDTMPIDSSGNSIILMLNKNVYKIKTEYNEFSSIKTDEHFIENIIDCTFIKLGNKFDIDYTEYASNLNFSHIFNILKNKFKNESVNKNMAIFYTKNKNIYLFNYKDLDGKHKSYHSLIIQCFSVDQQKLIQLKTKWVKYILKRI